MYVKFLGILLDKTEILSQNIPTCFKREAEVGRKNKIKQKFFWLPQRHSICLFCIYLSVFDFCLFERGTRKKMDEMEDWTGFFYSKDFTLLFSFFLLLFPSSIEFKVKKFIAISYYFFLKPLSQIWWIIRKYTHCVGIFFLSSERFFSVLLYRKGTSLQDFTDSDLNFSFDVCWLVISSSSGCFHRFLFAYIFNSEHVARNHSFSLIAGIRALWRLSLKEKWSTCRQAD